MSTAIAGVAIGGAGVLGSAISGRKSRKAAKKSAEAAQQSEADRLNWEKEQYQDWQDTYGSIEDNLSRYYDTLSSTTIIAQGLEAHEKERDLAMTQLGETLAKHNISRSGIQAQLSQQNEMGSAEERARIRARAPMETAKEKLNFLRVGMGQNPAEGVGSALSDTAQSSGRRADMAAASAGRASSSLISSVTDLAQAGVNYWDSRPSRPAATTSPANPTTPSPIEYGQVKPPAGYGNIP